MLLQDCGTTGPTSHCAASQKKNVNTVPMNISNNEANTLWFWGHVMVAYVDNTVS